MSTKRFTNVLWKRFLHKKPEFTTNKYNVTRSNFNRLSETHIRFFQDLLGTSRVLTDSLDLEKYNVDWLLQLRGNSSIALKPKSTNEVAKILSFCNRNRLAVCPQGGNTGVSGGSVPVFDEVIISAELLNKIISFEELSGVVLCQSGCVLANIDNYIAQKGLMVPLDLASRGTCQIGGNVSTNAGGIRLFKYGNLHSNVLGLEVVKPDGEILDMMSSLKKDNTGFHLKNIFIGAEGTLGYVTKVALHCPPCPKFVHLAFLGLENFDKVLNAFGKAKSELGEILSAVEVMDSATMEFAKEFNKVDSLIGDYPYYLLLETVGSNIEHDYKKLNKFFEVSLEEQIVSNGTVVEEPSKIKSIWNIRDISHGFKHCGPILLYDISLPLKDYFVLVETMRKQLGTLSPRVFGFGHLGDGNLHFNVQLHNLDEQIYKTVDNLLIKQVMNLKGSMSAEHGLGFLKRHYFPLSKPDSVVRVMKNLKMMFDPNGIMNPYKVFP